MKPLARAIRRLFGIRKKTAPKCVMHGGELDGLYEKAKSEIKREELSKGVLAEQRSSVGGCDKESIDADAARRLAPRNTERNRPNDKPNPNARIIYADAGSPVAMEDDRTPAMWTDEYETSFSREMIAETRNNNPRFTSEYNGYVTTVAVCVNGMRIYHGYTVNAVGADDYPSARLIQDAAVNACSMMTRWISDLDASKDPLLEKPAEKMPVEFDLAVGKDITGQRVGRGSQFFSR